MNLDSLVKTWESLLVSFETRSIDIQTSYRRLAFKSKSLLWCEVAVHLGTGIWGTLAEGLFGSSASTDQFLIQLTGVGIVAAFCITFSWVVLTLIEKIWGLRVVRVEELDGLDQAEHGGMTAYADIRMNQH